MKNDEIEVSITELKILLIVDNGDVFKVDMDKEMQRIIYSTLKNTFKPDIPLVPESYD